MKYPGKNTKETIMSLNTHMVDEFIKFMNYVSPPMADIGEKNAKSIYMASEFVTDIDQVNSNDFNFDFLNTTKKYKTVTCFEIVEHVQNPLFFLKNVSDLVDRYGRLFVSMPGRPRFLWTKHHFHEMTPKRFEKWICEPLGLMIIRKKKVRIGRKWKLSYVVGLRPLIRSVMLIFCNYTWIYEIRKTK